MKQLPMKKCKRYNAQVTEKFCKDCQKIAQEVFLKLINFPEGGVKISDISNTDIDRFVTCGDCPENALPLPVDVIENKVRNVLKLDLKDLISKGPKEEIEEDEIQRIAGRV